MQNFGFYFGFPMGFVLFGVLQVLPNGGCCRSAASSSVGRSTSSASTMIFEPVHYRSGGCRGIKACWSSGKTRSPSCYARIVADHVITLQNVGHELLYGTRSDRTLQCWRFATAVHRHAVDEADAHAGNRLLEGNRGERSAADAPVIASTSESLSESAEINSATICVS